VAIPRYRRQDGPAFLSAGFRPFFLLGALWAALAIPIWLAIFAGELRISSNLSPIIWHVHEMVFGYGAAVVSGFLLTAIPNWTGRMPLQDGSLSALVALWIVGRFAVLFSAEFGAEIAMLLDLAFPTVFAGVIAREIIAGRNWRNLPMLGALVLLLAANPSKRSPGISRSVLTATSSSSVSNGAVPWAWSKEVILHRRGARKQLRRLEAFAPQRATAIPCG
jgi:uncharacterized protein involved in response to NO